MHAGWRNGSRGSPDDRLPADGVALMRVHVVDPSAFTPPYDHALCSALAQAGAQVELITSAFAYGAPPQPDGYSRRTLFYACARGAAGSPLRLASKLAEHPLDMLRYRRAALSADVVHFQWLAVQWLDRHLLPRRPVVLTAHDLLPREPRLGQLWAQRRLYDAVQAVVVHSEYGRRALVDELGVDAAKVRVIHHGAFDYLLELAGELPAELADPGSPVVLFFGLLRPYKGVDVLLDAWRRIGDAAGQAELWIVGRPRMELAALRRLAGPTVRFVPRFVTDAELAACFRRADLVVLPYTETERLDFSGVLATSLAFAKPTVVSDVGGFGELAQAGAARLVPPADADALGAVLAALLDDPDERARLAAAARAAAAGPYSWERAAQLTLALYRELVAG
jgi:glycosyltransferase involved in cell wall biosynthesis